MQRALVRARAQDARPDTLVLLEHEPVYTVGRSGKDPHFTRPAPQTSGIPVYHVERGGSVTYHGPGQLMGYPILRLRSYCPGPRRYMRMLEDVLIRTVADWGLVACRVEPFTGVWVGGKKLASLGVRISEGVTMHGFALNVSTDLRPFQAIVPCGIAGCQVTSMAEALGRPVAVPEVQARLIDVFAEVFELRWVPWRDPDPWEQARADDVQSLALALAPAPGRGEAPLGGV